MGVVQAEKIWRVTTNGECLVQGSSYFLHQNRPGPVPRYDGGPKQSDFRHAREIDYDVT